MTTRTFKQFGQGYGSTPATIVATIDGVQVFNGPVNTVDEPLPLGPVTNPGSEIFTWTNTVDFAGTQSFSISVTGSSLLLTVTSANYPFLQIDTNVTEPFIINSSVDFSYFYTNFYTKNVNGVNLADPFTNVTIGGVPQQRAPRPNDSELPGQWYWLIPAGSTFTATLNVMAGTDPASPGLSTP
jgi:hypothetical protein